MQASTATYLHYYKGNRRNIVISCCLSLAQAGSLIPVAVIIQRIFDNALPEREGGVLLFLLGLLLVLLCVNASAILWNRHLSLGIIKSAIGNMRKDLVAHAMALSRQHYANEDLDAMHTRIVSDSERIDSMTSALLTQFFPGMLVALGLSLFLAYENPPLFLVVALTVPLLYGAGRLVGSKVRDRIRTFHRDFSEFSKGVLFVLKFNELIKFSAAETGELKRQQSRIQHLRVSSRNMAWLATAYSVIQNNILVVSGIAVLLFGGLEVVNGSATVGSLISFYVALNLLSANAGSVINAIPVIIEGRESLRSLAPLLETSNGGDNAKSLEPFLGFKNQIAFEQVSFRHADSNFSLENISFAVKKGELFGIFGASGSGKSTLIQLLLGFYPPDRGRVSVDGNDTHRFNTDEYRRSFGILSQDLFIFPATIRENLTYGLVGVDDERLKKVCEVCRIHEYIRSLPQEYDTQIGEHGIKVSGGQRQRIAIARAVLRQPEILVLDEPDNNIDEAMFLLILENIRKLPMTVIVISHNKNLRQFVDNAYLLT